jgi:DNA polymerase III subunit gamma/tau
MTTLYRTYRPNTFDDVVGQEAAVRELRALLSAGSLPHSLLLVGGRGIGKTTIARIIANELGTAPEDIYELDAASNRGVDDIRELRENVATMPLRSPFKVYILDEVHMLTPQAWNAFLKTLEEPPAHVKFLMATTEIHMVPETIISRSRVIRLQMPSVSDIATHILNVAKSENFKLDADGAEVIAVSAGGSFRDALVSLQSVIASSDSSPAAIARLLGVPQLDTVRAWLRALHKLDTAAALTVLAGVQDAGSDTTFFLELAIARVRAVLSARVGIASTSTNTLDNELVAELIADKPMNSTHLSYLVDAMRSARQIPNPHVVLELATYRICGQ